MSTNDERYTLPRSNISQLMASVMPGQPPIPIDRSKPAGRITACLPGGNLQAEPFEERAALRVFDGGIDRIDAEMLAHLDVTHAAPGVIFVAAFPVMLPCNESKAAMNSESPATAHITQLSDIAAKINIEHAAYETVAQKALHHALVVGDSLTQAKQLVAHGGFEKWVSENCDFTARQARNYMTIARDLRACLERDPKRNCNSDLTVAGARRLIRESAVPQTSILRIDRVRRRAMIERWLDIRLSQFMAFTAAGYSAVEIASIFDWPEKEVVADLERLKNPPIPNRHNWFQTHGIDGEGYHQDLQHGVLYWRHHCLQNASSSAETGLGKRSVANRLHAESKALVCEQLATDWCIWDSTQWSQLGRSFGVTPDDSGCQLLGVALYSCWCSDHRVTIGLEVERPMDELFRVSLTELNGPQDGTTVDTSR
jgi:hypothetical protein